MFFGYLIGSNSIQPEAVTVPEPLPPEIIEVEVPVEVVQEVEVIKEVEVVK